MRVEVLVLAVGLTVATGPWSPPVSATSPSETEPATPRLSPAAQTWVDSHGGLLDHHRMTHLRDLTARLANAAGLRPVTLWILDNPSLKAASAPPNDVFLHAGLLELLTDAQVAAVIAHEMGHLAELHDAAVYHCVDERHGTLDEEAHADAVGLVILDRAGCDTTAMIAAMTRVRDRISLKDPAWGVIHRRIVTLRRTYAALFAPVEVDAGSRG